MVINEEEEEANCTLMNFTDNNILGRSESSREERSSAKWSAVPPLCQQNGETSEQFIQSSPKPPASRGRHVSLSVKIRKMKKPVFLQTHPMVITECDMRWPVCLGFRVMVNGHLLHPDSSSSLLPTLHLVSLLCTSGQRPTDTLLPSPTLQADPETTPLLPLLLMLRFHCKKWKALSLLKSGIFGGVTKIGKV